MIEVVYGPCRMKVDAELILGKNACGLTLTENRFR
jgi:hypothetical protein